MHPIATEQGLFSVKIHCSCESLLRGDIAQKHRKIPKTLRIHNQNLNCFSFKSGTGAK
jgi:hypothetical protein